jgi:hypothetical protein
MRKIRWISNLIVALTLFCTIAYLFTTPMANTPNLPRSTSSDGEVPPKEPTEAESRDGTKGTATTGSKFPMRPKLAPATTYVVPLQSSRGIGSNLQPGLIVKLNDPSVKITVDPSYPFNFDIEKGQSLATFIVHENPPATPSSRIQTISIKTLQSAEELSSHIACDTTFRAKYGVVKTGGSFHLDYNKYVGNRSAFVAIHYECLSKSYDLLKLGDISKSKHLAFVGNAEGLGIVTKSNRGVKFSIIAEITERELNELKRLETEFSYDAKKSGATITTDYTSLHRALSKETKFSVLSIGGLKPDAATTLLKAFEKTKDVELKSLFNAFANSIEIPDADEEMPFVSHEIEPLSNYLLAEPGSLIAEEEYKDLLALEGKYLDYDNARNLYEFFLENQSAWNPGGTQADIVNRLKTIITQIDSYKKSVRTYIESEISGDSTAIRPTGDNISLLPSEETLSIFQKMFTVKITKLKLPEGQDRPKEPQAKVVMSMKSPPVGSKTLLYNPIDVTVTLVLSETNTQTIIENIYDIQSGETFPVDTKAYGLLVYDSKSKCYEGTVTFPNHYSLSAITAADWETQKHRDRIPSRNRSVKENSEKFKKVWDGGWFVIQGNLPGNLPGKCMVLAE